MYDHGNRIRYAIWAIGGFLAFCILTALIFPATPFFGYAWHKVETTEAGIKINSGKFDGVLCAGTYTDMFDSYADIVDINVSGVPFEGLFEEVLTNDLQRIGVKVTGIAFPPNCTQLTEEMWIRYKNILTNKKAFEKQVVDQTQQATKACVGDVSFERAAVGASRNDLKDCIDEQTSILLEPFGINVSAVAVPDIVISAQVQSQLDAITTSKNDTLLAQQDEQKFRAQAQRDLAQQQGVIMVQQGEIQEKYRQDAMTADLQRQSTEAQRAVIEAEIENQKLEAQGRQDVSKIDLETAKIEAQANNADAAEQARIMQEHPLYAQFLRVIEMAKAWAGVDKIVVPAGTSPVIMFGDDALPTVEVGPDQTQ